MLSLIVLLAASAFAQVGLPTTPKGLFSLTAPTPTVLELDAIKNATMTKGAPLNLNGKSGTMTFVLARNKEAFAAISGEGDAEPRFFHLRSLWNHDQQVAVNGKNYKVSMSANVFDKVATKVHLESGNESASYSIREMMAHEFAVGQPFLVNGREYRVSIYDEVVKDDRIGKADPSRQNIAIMAREGKNDFKIYLFPLEETPVGKMTIHELSGDKVGIARLDAARVALIPNP
jgi:hypothetical protein